MARCTGLSGGLGSGFSWGGGGCQAPGHEAGSNVELPQLLCLALQGPPKHGAKDSHPNSPFPPGQPCLCNPDSPSGNNRASYGGYTTPLFRPWRMGERHGWRSWAGRLTEGLDKESAMEGRTHPSSVPTVLSLTSMAGSPRATPAPLQLRGVGNNCMG